jgi:hypothetical protein
MVVESGDVVASMSACVVVSSNTLSIPLADIVFAIEMGANGSMVIE